MDTAATLDLFNRTVRQEIAPLPWRPVVRSGGVVRLVGPADFIIWWDLGEDDAPAAVASQAAAALSAGKRLSWRVYEFDDPPGLPDCLRAAGFVAGDVGTLLFLDLATAAFPMPPLGIRVERIVDEAGLDLYLRVAGEAFGEAEPGQREAFIPRLGDPDFPLCLALVDGAPAGGGRLEMTCGESFGYLFGGGVTPALRGRGAYQALVWARAAEARKRGLRYLATEARDTSRPILQRLGFVPISPQTTWVLSP
jgi:hypothetical protein